MTHPLPLSPAHHQWVVWVATRGKVKPTHDGESWLLHITPALAGARTVTLRIRWSGTDWQLITVSNAEDWHTHSPFIDELCFDSQRGCFWRCQAGPVSTMAQESILADFLGNLQRLCTHHRYTVESEEIAPCPNKP